MVAQALHLVQAQAAALKQVVHQVLAASLRAVLLVQAQAAVVAQAVLLSQVAVPVQQGHPTVVAQQQCYVTVLQQQIAIV